MNLVTKLLEKGTAPRPGLPMQEVRSITIHWIGPYPGQSVNDPIAYWTKNNLEASAHYVVKGSDVVNCIPVNEVAWHCGCDGNYSSIGIEVIPAYIDGMFSNETVETLKELIMTLPNVPLKRHYDWTGKDCPKYYCENSTWEDLKKCLS